MNARTLASIEPQHLAETISYVEAPHVSALQLAELFQASGIARALTDFSYCCYLSDLAVARQYQRHGIGRELIQRVKRCVGEKSMLLLLSSPEAMQYYPRIGLEPVANGWIIKRKV